MPGGLARRRRRAQAGGIAYEDTTSCPLPTGPPFAAEVELRPGGSRVKVFGVLDALAVSVVDACLIGLWDAGMATVELDLTAVLHAGATATPTLDAWAARAGDRAGDLVLRRPAWMSGN